MFVHGAVLVGLPGRQVDVLKGKWRRVVAGFRRVMVMPPGLAKRLDFTETDCQRQEEARVNAGFLAGPINPIYFHGLHCGSSAEKPLIDKLSGSIDLIDIHGKLAMPGRF
jgi:hypothetical protein